MKGMRNMKREMYQTTMHERHSQKEQAKIVKNRRTLPGTANERDWARK